MTKKIISILLCLALCLCLVGCGSKTENTTTFATLEPEKTTKGTLTEKYADAAVVATEFLTYYFNGEYVNCFTYGILDFQEYDYADFRKNIAEGTAEYEDLNGYYKYRTSKLTNGAQTADNFVDAWNLLGSVVKAGNTEQLGNFQFKVKSTKIVDIDEETAKSMIGNSIYVTQKNYGDYLDISQLFEWEMVEDYVGVDVNYIMEGELDSMENTFGVDLFKIDGQWKVLLDYAPIQ